VEPESVRAILGIAHNAFVTLDADGTILDWNLRAQEVFGYSRSEAIGREAAELIVPARYRSRHRAALRRVLDTGAMAAADSPRFHLEGLRRDGSELPIELAVTAVREQDGWRFHAWIQDVSERTELLHELEAQLRGGPGFPEILDALAEAVTIRDPHHHIIYANRAAVNHMGFASLDELQRRPPQSIIGDYTVHDEHGREVTMDDIPSVRLMAGKPVEPLLIRTINRDTGRVRWNLLKASGLHDAGGKLVAAVTIIEDVTREKTAELQDRFLARATETLMSSLDYEETLGHVAWLVVPEIADWCAVDLVDERGKRQRVVVAHRDAEKLELAERLRRYEPEEPDPDQGVGRVLRTGVAELYPEIADELLVEAAIDEEQLRLLRAVGLRSLLIVPLLAGGRTLGVMTLVMAESERRFTQSDLEFARALASRAAVAVDNSRLATARREIAATLQRSLLPEVVPPIEGWDVATMYRAARGAEEVEVGGDFYDFIQIPDGWVVLLGDVTGKGVEAAAMTSLVRHGARFLSKQEQSPGKILARLNDELREQSGMWLCSALCVRLHQDRVVISSAGHPAPFIVREDGRIREIGVTGPILGAWSGAALVERSVPIGLDEMLFLFTDGVVDTRGESERFGTHRLKRVLSEHAGLPPEALLVELESALEDFQQHAQFDDTAAVALRPSLVEQESTSPLAPAGRRMRTLPEVTERTGNV
jgi:PAS domain S-box-containing protein